MNQDDNLSMLDIPLQGEEVAGRPLRRMKLAGHALVVGVRRGGEVLVPQGATIVGRGEFLVVVGNPETLRDARRQFDPTAPNESVRQRGAAGWPRRAAWRAAP